jgi:outer membrane protein
MSLLLFSVVLAANGQVLTLDEALRTAAALQPQLRQAQANIDIAKARADETRSALLPQIGGSASYRYSIGSSGSGQACITTSAGVLNCPSGVTPGSMMMGGAQPSTTSINNIVASLSGSQTLFDYPTFERWRSANVSTQAQWANAESARLSVELVVRTNYFNARGSKALVRVQVETLQNQDRHLQQIQGFVKVGTRPEIDLAQARTDRANALVQKINAENNYRIAKAQLNQAIGIEGSIDYDVADDVLPPVAGESRPIEQQVDEAMKARPDLLSIDRQLRAQELLIRAAKGGYAPTLGFSTALTDSGVLGDPFVWNWSASVNANWSLFQGLFTLSQVREQKALLASLVAQRDAIRQQIRLDVEQARVAVEGALAALGAADEALVNARERLRLAEGRYQAGVGSVIELGDAQVALTNAAAQRVTAEYTLFNARAQLLRALGRH